MNRLFCYCSQLIKYCAWPCCEIQVDLLLGKAYSDWGHISDAVAVYDQVISSHPEDFRGYLAKVSIHYLVPHYFIAIHSGCIEARYFLQHYPV